MAALVDAQRRRAATTWPCSTTTAASSQRARPREARSRSPLYKTLSDGRRADLGRAPTVISSASGRSTCASRGSSARPTGRRLAALLRENSRDAATRYVIFSTDEGATWSEPRELPGALTGDRHVAAIRARTGGSSSSFRDMAHESPTKGDWVGLGRHVRRHRRRPRGAVPRAAHGQHRGRRLRLPRASSSCPTAPSSTTTYGHWTEGEEPYVVSVRLKLDELDDLAR
ncbi:MAG: hypothetical protein MZV64_11305 [Ignavibacteriales bacterium]|nr:hypothetical protein [Ignavibacteriales bacterium]